MRRTNSAIILMILLVLLTSLTPGENKRASLEFMKISQAYNSHTKLFASIKYSVYYGYSSNLLESTMNGSYQRNDSLVVFKLDNIITYASRTQSISVNSADLEIYLADAQPEMGIKEQFLSIEKHLEMASSVTVMDSIDSKQKMISLSFEDDYSIEFEKVDIYYGSDYLVRKIVMYIPEAGYLGYEYQGKKMKLVIDYTYKPFSFNFQGGMFQMDNYAKKTGEDFKGIGKYENYKIIDLRTRKL